MAKFVYSARDMAGALVRGEIEASEVREAKKLISKSKLFPIEVKPFTNQPQSLDFLAQLKSSLLSWRSPVKKEDLLMLFQQLETIYTVGVPLLRGLDLIQNQTENPFLRNALASIRKDVGSGKPLSEAMEKFPEAFDNVTINLVKVGEATGQLAEILDRISRLTQQRLEQRAKVKSATFYPKIVVGMMGIVLIAVVYFVIPKFKEFFGRFGGELPGITRLMMGTSEFFQDYWYLIFGTLFIAITSFQKWVHSPEGRRTWDALLLKAPIFGTLFLQIEVASFCGILELLIKSGIPINQSLEILRGSLSNTVVQKEVADIRAAIEKGDSLSAGVQRSTVLPKTATNLISIGEEAGSLEKTLNRLGNYYNLQVDYRLANLSKAIEPILLAFIFGIVLALALAVFLPMWKMNSLIKK